MQKKDVFQNLKDPKKKVGQNLRSSLMLRNGGLRVLLTADQTICLESAVETILGPPPLHKSTIADHCQESGVKKNLMVTGIHSTKPDICFVIVDL